MTNLFGKTNFATVIIAGVLMMSGCNKTQTLTPAPFFDNSALASVCMLYSDSNYVILRDYFPGMDRTDTIGVRVDTTSSYLGLIDVTQGEEKSVIVYKNMIRLGEPDKAPFLTTVRRNSTSFDVKVENKLNVVAVLWQNTVLTSHEGLKVINDSLLRVKVPLNAKQMKRSYMRVFASNLYGIGNDVLIPLEYGKIIEDPSLLNRTDKHTQILYSLMIDRFYNGDTTNDRKLNVPEVNPKVDYWGGDLSGVTRKIEEGYFDTLGITTIWLSPITQNPYDAWGQIFNPKTKFSGYHGYWPLYLTVVDSRFGNEQILRQLLDAAHADNKNVILDYVSNHVHINSPLLKAHPDWTTPSNTPDGRPNRQLWDEFRLTTWFDDHIPSLDLEKPEVCDQISDSALFWMQHYDFDGFRHDATKHIPEVYWRMLTRKLLDSVPDRTLFQIGETYGSVSLIASYVKTGMLDGQFDFNVYDTFIWATTTQEGSFEALAKCIGESQTAYGSHNLMGNITGNHDRCRYVSIAGGDILPDEDNKLAGWQRDIGVTDQRAYEKLKLLHAMNFTLPGLPCVYYGDEYGDPGANDPDNRRWMRFDNLSEKEQDVLSAVKSLTALRRGSMPLLYGDYKLLSADRDVISYMRSYMGEYVITILNKSDEAKEVKILLPLGLTYDGKSQFVATVDPVSFKIIQNK
ncbi:MAG: alpha-amylase family glycosyl hydrolase [Bacteroidales bacterium]|nr:alpha-amylase family glycosyl hydrolase [Bacteroidales bacterium]